MATPTPNDPTGWASLGHRLDQARNYDDVFTVVRESVRRVLGRERVGLGLGLSELPAQVGAYWQVTGNIIVLNERLIRVLDATEPQAQRTAFLYVVILHEYLHSLGFLDERRDREVVSRVATQALGEDHAAAVLARGDLWEIFPQLRGAGTGDGQRVKIVRGFDSESTNRYIR
ncbi:MAG: hypothetical protein L3K14_08440 [Thermoplasmata archaeon]|nr:hypothetical protein [Thermoplasmata archaeon]